MMAGGAYQDFTNSGMQTTTQAGGRVERALHRRNELDHRVRGRVRRCGAAVRGPGRHEQHAAAGARTVWRVTVRLNVPLRYGAYLFEPYGYAGLGYSHYTVSNYNQNAQRLSSFTSTDDVMNVPGGRRFRLRLQGVHHRRARGLDGDVLPEHPAGADSAGTLDHWNVGGQVGFTF